MIRIIFFAATLLLCCCKLTAQQFENRFKTALPDSVVHSDLSWVDLDNDSLLDVFVVATNIKNRQFFITYKSDTTQGLTWKSTTAADFTNIAHLIVDADLDNDMDIILSGNGNGTSATFLLENKGGFALEAHPMFNLAGTVLKMSDFDQDGKKELLISGTHNGMAFLSFYRQVNNQWQATALSKISATALEVFDFDADGKNDFFVSGRRDDSSIATSVFHNDGDFIFSEIRIKPAIDGVSSAGDLDHDGDFDIVVAGIDSLSRNTSVILINEGGAFRAVNNSLPAPGKANLLVADFDIDGKCDISIHSASGDTVNVIFNDRQIENTLNTKGLQAQAFGDADRDGDLDLLQVLKNSSGLEIVVSLNNSDSVNKAPKPPANGLGVKIFNRLFLYWDKPSDDRTPANALTYDLTLQTSSGDLIVGEYDMIHNRRLTVSHGNNGNNNYALLKGAASSGIAFRVQSVDNAFHAGAGPKGVCHGACITCVELKTENVEVCKNEQVKFTSAGSALWFSFAKGFLGYASTYEYKAEASDTIFSFSPGRAGCSAVNVYVIEIGKKLVRKTEQLKYVCEGALINLGVETEWETVEWRSASIGFLSNADTITYTVMKNDTISVKMDDGSGCQLQRNTALVISKPVATVNGETFQILKGEQVQLSATGGEAYLWEPLEGLSANNIASPVAAPLKTTEYLVTISDSLGCAVQPKVLVIVETTAFIPNLFTPNDDGRNDELRIFGLANAENFSFSIHNREGHMVYQSNNVSEVISSGWNGTYKGTKQPSGVYYWKVKGEYSGGRVVLLNGKNSGSIVLIR